MQNAQREVKKECLWFMAYSTKKTKFGPKIQQWQEEIDTEFNGFLLPTPLIRIKGTKMLQSRTISDGEIRLEKIEVRIQHGRIMEKALDIYVERFNASVNMSQGHQCTWPECKRNREPTNNARDSLYLCEFHRRRMEDYFTKMCADNGVFINQSYSPGDFEGYTALMELFESALRQTSAVCDQGSTEEGKLLQDLYLNVRNFVIIVSAVIKPDEDLLSSFLPHIMSIALKIVKSHYQQPISNLVSFMQHFIEYILLFFGIMSPWDSAFPGGRPYREIGMGIGGFVGVLGLFVFSPPQALAAMGVGGLLGAVVGNNLYISQRRREMLNASYCRYLMFRHTQQNYQGEDTPEDMNFLTGSAYGDTLLAFVLIVQTLVILMAL